MLVLPSASSPRIAATRFLGLRPRKRGTFGAAKSDIAGGVRAQTEGRVRCTGRAMPAASSLRVSGRQLRLRGPRGTPRVLPARPASAGVADVVAALAGVGRGAGQHPAHAGGRALCPPGEGLGEGRGRTGRVQQEWRAERGSCHGLRSRRPHCEGVSAVILRRAPGNVWDIEHTADGRIRRIKRKVPRPWVNHYAFLIMDRYWGHMIIRFCPHPPFNALVILNGHEWVAREAERRQLAFSSGSRTTASRSCPTPGTWALSQMP